MTIFFKIVDFNKNFDTFIEVRKNADKELLGYIQYSTEQIQQYIKKNLSLFGGSAFFHIYIDDSLIGQLELGTKDNLGYVYLFYIIPEFRGRGYFKHIHAKMIEIMNSRNFTKVRLSTPKTNIKTLDIYKYYGWINVGINPHKENMLLLELELELSPGGGWKLSSLN